VFNRRGRWAREAAKSLLESQGIPAMLRYESIGRVFGVDD
jgi:hypothetical protein